MTKKPDRRILVGVTGASGSIYAERYIEWAAEKGLCINTSTMFLAVPVSPSKCDTNQAAASTASSSRRSTVR